MWSLKATEKYRGMFRGESSGCKGITSSIFFNRDISCTIGLSSNMLKENQIEDLHLYLNMICDIINLVFNKMEETFQSNTLDWSSLVFLLISFHLNVSPFITPSIINRLTSNFQQMFKITRLFLLLNYNEIGPGVGTGRGLQIWYSL